MSSPCPVPDASPPTAYWLSPKDRLQQVIDALRADGHTVIGPVIDQQAILYDEVADIAQLPRGWTDVQGPGLYRLQRTDDNAWFDFVVGPHSWKKYLYPPRLTLSSATPTSNGWQFETRTDESPRYAFLGVRACELAAIRVQDRVLLDGPYVDPVYQSRREQAFVLAVNCTRSGTNCFCASMNAGPQCTAGFDLALTETPDGFVFEVGSERGRHLLARCDVREATPTELSAAATARQRAVDQQTKRMDTAGLPQLLMTQLEHPRWQVVGERCLSCTNCTMVCPTCFCCSVEDVPDLNTGRVDRERQWDSCFHEEFSNLNGRPVRNDIRSRYRQWLTHKLATWHDQFGTSGCVGCGRCITWCPVGIDLTEEVAAIRETAP
jgi:sulfhydrogenase subunit beta (sulfur reductase)